MHGDGGQSRGFTYIDDVLRANQAAAAAPAEACHGQIYNIAGEASYSLMHLLEVLGRILHVEPAPVYVDGRAGDIRDIRDSRADGARARASLGWAPQVGFEDGLRRAFAWFERKELR